MALQLIEAFHCLKGTLSNRIKLTKDEPSNSEPKWPDDVRLVDEPSVHLGRLQLLFQGKWRGVCANFQK